ncbi:glycosyltransferase [Glutamicibacter bergerei]|uniref:D-inositol 3-phosphate glycosyltransferase n=1 Tax=Glutamicibacter bergerei TaxID=256702 RepID=A0ABV9MIK3_9MICC
MSIIAAVALFQNIYTWLLISAFSLSVVFTGTMITLVIRQSTLSRLRRLESYARWTREQLKANEQVTESRANTSIISVGLIGRRVKSLEGKQKILTDISSEMEILKKHLNRTQPLLEAAQSALNDNSSRQVEVYEYLCRIHDEITVQRASLERVAQTETTLNRIQSSLVSKEDLSETSNLIRAEFRTDDNTVLKRELIRAFLLATQFSNTGRIFTDDELRLLSTEISRLDPLLVAWVYLEHDAVSVLPLSEKRRLVNATRQLGYWTISNKILREIIATNKKETDVVALSRRNDELEVFRGNLQPKIDPITTDFKPLTGHVLHVVGKVLPKTQSGYTLRTHYSARAQSRSGYKVSVVSLAGEFQEDTTRNSQVIDGISYFGLVGLPRNKWNLSEWLQDNVDQVSNLVQEIRPAALHAHSDFLNAYVATVVARAFGIPVVYESRGFWEESWLSRISQTFDITDWSSTGRHFGLPDAYKLRQDMEVEMRNRADHVVTLAKVMEDHIVDLGTQRDKVTVIPNAVDSTQFPVLDRDIDLIDDIGIPQDALVIGYISSIVEYEGIDILVRSFNERVHGELRNAHLLIVGDGAELNPLKKLVQELDTPRVHFTGRVPHASILRYYSLIDIFVVPRRPVEVCQLVTPLKPFEAFSTGRAVIMSDVGALREIAEQGGCARLFQAGDHLSLANELVTLSSDPKLRKELGRKAASWVRSERSWDRNAQAYERVYEMLGVQKSETHKEK